MEESRAVFGQLSIIAGGCVQCREVAGEGVDDVECYQLVKSAVGWLVGDCV